MAQGDWTKSEAEATKEAVGEIFDGLSRPKKGEFLGHLDDILLFLERAKKEAPEE